MEPQVHAFGRTLMFTGWAFVQNLIQDFCEAKQFLPIHRAESLLQCLDSGRILRVERDQIEFGPAYIVFVLPVPPLRSTSIHLVPNFRLFESSLNSKTLIRNMLKKFVRAIREKCRMPVWFLSLEWHAKARTCPASNAPNSQSRATGKIAVEPLEYATNGRESGSRRLPTSQGFDGNNPLSLNSIRFSCGQGHAIQKLRPTLSSGSKK
jgi:hypothetical protein